MIKVQYRVVTDAYCGFEVQRRKKGWFGWSSWKQVGINTHSTLEKALQMIEGLKGKVVWTEEPDL